VTEAIGGGGVDPVLVISSEPPRTAVPPLVARPDLLFETERVPGSSASPASRSDVMAAAHSAGVRSGIRRCIGTFVGGINQVPSLED
jgi:hypothetical protein